MISIEKHNRALERRTYYADVYPIKYYSKEGLVERKLEINEEDLEKIIEGPMNIWLYAKCRTYVDPDNPEEDEAVHDAEVEITGDYDGNP